MASLRIGFMGTPDFALAALKALCASDHEVVVVYSQPPRPKGRGQKVQPSPVHAYAQEQGIPVLTPRSVKSPEALADFAGHDLDLAVVAAYGLILPAAILEAPKDGCLNIHASLLPRWRGASPIQQAIWAGDDETGISIMQMDEGLDTGPVIAERFVSITNKTTASTLHDSLAALGGEMIVEVMEELAQAGVLLSEPQDDTQKTYAPLLTKEDGRVDWTQSAQEIDRQVRALNPWPGVFCEHDGKRVKILEALPVDEQSDQPFGTILNREGDVSCSDGTLRLIKIQPLNAKAMDFTSAVNGGYIKIGECFS